MGTGELPMNTVAESPRRFRFILFFLAVWLWLGAFWALCHDLPWLVHMYQNLGMPYPYQVLWWMNWGAWVLFGAAAFGLLSVLVRRLRVVGLVALLIIPAALLTCTYAGTGLGPTHVQAIINAVQQPRAAE